MSATYVFVALASAASACLGSLRSILKIRQIHKEIMDGTPEQHEARRKLEAVRRPVVWTRRLTIGHRDGEAADDGEMRT